MSHVSFYAFLFVCTALGWGFAAALNATAFAASL
jgi:hypothetical protein